MKVQWLLGLIKRDVVLGQVVDDKIRSNSSRKKRPCLNRALRSLGHIAKLKFIRKKGKSNARRSQFYYPGMLIFRIV